MGYGPAYGRSGSLVSAHPQRLTVVAGPRATELPQRDRLAEEQAALRRVATLVAQGAPAETLFAVVAEQVAEVLRVPLVSIVRYESDGTATERASVSPAGRLFRVGTRWSLEGTNVVAEVGNTCRPARINDYTGLTGTIAEAVRSLGIRSTVGIPIAVAGRLWGVMVVSSTEPEPLPADTEAHLADFTDLVATAIANGEAWDEVQRLADEQAALRRVATLVARDASQTELFGAIAEEIRQLLGADEIRMARYEDDCAVVTASSGVRDDVFAIGSRHPLAGDNALSRVSRTGMPARIDRYESATGPIAETGRAGAVRAVVAAPVRVEGRLWGAIITATSGDEPLPPETESRLGQFTDLMATAIANTEARARADRLAEEQAVLRRVATLVAKESSLAEVFAKVAEEVANVFGDVECMLVRDERDGIGRIIAAWGDRVSRDFPIGTPVPVDGDILASVIADERPFRVDDYSAAPSAGARSDHERGFRSAVGCPIVVGDRIWGAMSVAKHAAEPFPPETESRIAQLTELVATAIANAEARAEVERLAEEQAALRRLATLVAEGASPTAVFDAVAAEIGALLDADEVMLSRYEPGDAVTVVATRGLAAELIAPGSRVSHQGASVTAAVRRTKRPARIESYTDAQGRLAEVARASGIRAAVGVPVVVNGRLWGVVQVSWTSEEPPPADTEARLSQFAEMLDTAIANADSRDQLDASRARLLTEADEARRRVVRDLHDGAQQRLMETILTLKLAKRAVQENGAKAESFIDQALAQAEQGNAELRELAHGILPGVLTRGGLRAAVRAVVKRVDLPVDVEIPAERFPEEIEASAYFIVAEALTNVVKHAQARRVAVRVFVEDGMLRLQVRDDGVGGVDPRGHGLVGIGDRVSALGGRFEIRSPPRRGTVLTAALPLSGPERRD